MIELQSSGLQSNTDHSGGIQILTTRHYAVWFYVLYLSINRSSSSSSSPIIAGELQFRGGSSVPGCKRDDFKRSFTNLASVTSEGNSILIDSSSICSSIQ